jgi:hypothetical protein
MALGWDDAIIGGLLVADFLIHKIFDEEPPKPKPAREIDIPRVDDGAPRPLIFGRCRVRSPQLEWISTPIATAMPQVFYPPLVDGQFIYEANMFFTLGFPFEGGTFDEATSRLHAMYIGDKKLQQIDQSVNTGNNVALSALTGDGGLGAPSTAAPYHYLGTLAYQAQNDPSNNTDESNVWAHGRVEFLNGKSTQEFLDGSDNPLTHVAENMLADGILPARIADYRGLLGVGLWGGPLGGQTHWVVGTSPQLGAYNWECSSYPSTARAFGPIQVGLEANPVDVIFEILNGRRGKLGISISRIDTESFEEAHATLLAEGHGYSRCIDTVQPAREMLAEICKQIYGVLYFDERVRKIKIKLIRADYDPDTLPVITPANGWKLDNFVISGRTQAVNKVRVVFLDRQLDYQENSATAQNLASAAAQDGIVREVVLQYPGVCTAELAATIAARELAARSRPLIKCTATCTRAFLRTNPGDLVRLTWPELNLSGIVMRNVGTNRGGIETNDVVLDLIQDISYVRRSTIVEPLVGFPVAVSG